MKSRQERKRNKIVHKYKFGQNVYFYENKYIRQGTIVGIKFLYNLNDEKRRLDQPEYAVLTNIGKPFQRTIIVPEWSIFKNQTECAVYVLREGILKEEESKQR